MLTGSFRYWKFLPTNEDQLDHAVSLAAFTEPRKHPFPPRISSRGILDVLPSEVKPGR